MGIQPRASRTLVAACAAGLLLALRAPAEKQDGAVGGGATFHLVQVERVLAGLASDPAAQAIQLRMRGPFQNELTGSRLVAHDAAGANPVVLLSFPAGVGLHGCGVTVLAATPSLVAGTVPAVVPDFTLTQPIPAGYLAAGSLTFEGPAGVAYWRLSWGGNAYTGPTGGDPANDADGEFGPPYPGELRASCALVFQPGCAAQSTSNAADYQEQPGAASFKANAGVVYRLDVSATATVRNGSGTNPVGFAAVDTPVLGGTWHTTVDIATPGAAASLVRVFLGGPVAGVPLKSGELLCVPPGLPTDVGVGTHALPVPLDCALLGRTFCTQAATVFLNPLRLELQNALDIRIGSS